MNTPEPVLRMHGTADRVLGFLGRALGNGRPQP